MHTDIRDRVGDRRQYAMPLGDADWGDIEHVVRVILGGTPWNACSAQLGLRALMCTAGVCGIRGRGLRRNLWQGRL